MANVMIQSRVKPELKEQAEIIFESMGLSMGDAIRIFLQQSVNVGGLPFQPTAKRPSPKTAAAIEELESAKGQRFSSVDALLADLESE